MSEAAASAPEPVLGRRCRWLLPARETRTEEFARQLGLTVPVASVLWCRGLRSPSDVSPFLRPRWEHLHSPWLLRDMDRAADRLALAVQSREPVLLYGDYDVDGTTSIVLLRKTLQHLGAHVIHHVPHRLRDGYGMRPEVLEHAVAQGIRLVVSLDTGIRAGSVIERARQLGLDVIITDHHLPDAELPAAFAVVNPKRPDCPYPEKNLCGAALALKLAQALLERLRWPEARVRKMVLSLLKMAALATVADVVPLTGENRTIVQLGLAGLDTARNPGLRELLRVAGIAPGRRPSAQEVGFRIGPRINAAGRMDSAEDVIELFLTSDEERARELAEKLHSQNVGRQQTEATILQAALQCLSGPVRDQDAALVFSGDSWHKGVIGIVASRLVELYHRPVFVMSRDPETGEVVGSGRSIRGFHLLEALDSMAELFERFGGHAAAAGITLKEGQVEAFRQRLCAYAEQRLTPADFRPSLEIDACVRLDELSSRAVQDLFQLAPFGCGNPEPLLLASDVEVAGPPSVVAEKHLRIPLRQGPRTVWVTAFRGTEWAQDLNRGLTLDVVVSLVEDSFAAARGLPNWSLVLQDFRVASAATV